MSKSKSQMATAATGSMVQHPTSMDTGVVDAPINAGGRKTRFRRLDRFRHMPWWVRWVRMFLLNPERFHDTWTHRLFGNNLLRKECWSLKPIPLAVGAAAGCFVCLTPTLPFQIMLTVALCVFLRGNIAMGFLATWISNPLTFVPIFGALLWVGCLLLGVPIPLHLYHDFRAGGSYLQFMEDVLSDFLAPLWVGSLVVGIPMTVGVYFVTFWTAIWLRRVHLVESIKERREMTRLRHIAMKEQRLIRRQERLENRLAGKRAKYAAKRVKLAEKRARITEHPHNSDHLRSLSDSDFDE